MQYRVTQVAFLVAAAVQLLGSRFASGADALAELVVLNAHVITVDQQHPRAEAFAVHDGRFIRVGDRDDVATLIGETTQVIDAGGRTVTPGFNDAHLHPGPVYDWQSPLGKVPCDPEHVATINGLIEALRAKADITPPGQWVFGSRYQDTKLSRHPTRFDLDRASTEHPIYLTHSSGHIAAVNSLALELARITKDTPDPRGGSFDRLEDGTPNGVLRESAKSIVRNAGPEPPQATTEEKLGGYKRRFAEYLSKGITSIQVAGTSLSAVQFYRLLQSSGERIRIYAMLRPPDVKTLQRWKNEQGLGNEDLKLGAIKYFHGNSLSGRTCWLYEPYADRPDYFGIPPKASQEELNETVWQIHKAGLQASIHSNGDREIDMVLNAYEQALQRLPRKDHRHRIEHCSVVNTDILKRVKELGIVLALHSYVYEHGDKMEAYGAARWNWMHVNRTAIDLGIPVAGNSDSPVSAADPLLRIQSMVTRKSAEGKVYGDRQRTTVEQAIRVWTMGSAFASFDEHIKGSITVGKLADFVVLNRDPLSVPPDELKDIQVDITVIGGHVVYERSAADSD